MDVASPRRASRLVLKAAALSRLVTVYLMLRSTMRINFKSLVLMVGMHDCPVHRRPAEWRAMKALVRFAAVRKAATRVFLTAARRQTNTPAPANTLNQIPGLA